MIDNESNEQNRSQDNVEYDTVLVSAGELGVYQVLLALATCPFFFFGVNVYFSQIFITEVPPEHWCWIPELENLTTIERRNLAIPKDDNARFGYSQCQAYDVNWEEVLLNGYGLHKSQKLKTVPCRNGWEYNRTEFPYPTISTDLEWVCDKQSYQATAQSIFFAGSVVGGIIIGWIADRFGRIAALVCSNLLGCIGGLSSTFTRNIIEFSICRFIMGMAYDTCVMMAFLILIEYTSPKYRSILPNVTFATFFSLFATLLPFIALACGHWKTLSLVTSIPIGFSIFAPLFLPESPRWLLAKGRNDKVIEKLLFIGRINRKEVPKNLIDQFKETFSKQNNEENVNSFEIFKKPLIRKVLLLMCLEYMCSQIVFDGLLRNLDQLNFDFFVSFAVSSFTEFPSLLLCAFVMDFFGRRWMAIITLLTSSIFCYLILCMKAGVASMTCASIARFAINMASNTIIQWSAEVFPTPVRGFGVSLVFLSSSVGNIISPYIAYLKVYKYWLPFTIIGSVAALGATIATMLPETAKKTLPHTYDDANNLIMNQSFWDVPFLLGKQKKIQAQDNPAFEMNTII